MKANNLVFLQLKASPLLNSKQLNTDDNKPSTIDTSNDGSNSAEIDFGMKVRTRQIQILKKKVVIMLMKNIEICWQDTQFCYIDSHFCYVDTLREG